MSWLKDLWHSVFGPGNPVSAYETIPLPEELTAGDPFFLAHARYHALRVERNRAEGKWRTAQRAKKASRALHADYVRLTNEVLALEALIKRGGE